MVVDFERSEILKQMPIFHEISPNRKRKHLYSTVGESCSGGPPYQRAMVLLVARAHANAQCGRLDTLRAAVSTDEQATCPTDAGMN